MTDRIASLLAWFLLGSVLVGIIGLLMPLILFLIGVGISVFACYLLAWLLGRFLS